MCLQLHIPLIAINRIFFLVNHIFYFVIVVHNHDPAFNFLYPKPLLLAIDLWLS